MGSLTFNSGMKMLSQRQYQAVYERAVADLRANEKDPLAFFFLGLVAAQNGYRDKALEFHAKAAEHGPRTVRYQAFYAKALLDGGDKAAAKARADKAAMLPCEDAFLSDMIGVVYSRSGHHDLALPFFKRAVKLNPKWPEFHFNLGASAQFTGDFAAAKTAYQNLLAVDPKFHRAWFALVGLETQSEDDNHLETLKALFADAQGDAEARLLLGHAIAKTLEDLGRYSESLDWLEKAKATKRAQVRYDRQASEQRFAQARALGQGRPVSALQDAPIFITGLPRTGTTLLDRILSSHNDVTSLGETELVDALLAQGLEIEDLGKAYLHAAGGQAHGTQRTTDKTPLNFLHTGLIHRVLPHARIIALRRGAMDSCLSNYRQMFAADRNQYDYSYDLADTAHYYRQFDSLISHWRKTLPPERFMEIHYEDLVRDQENQTRRLLAFCDLDWDEACLRFHDNAAPSDTASSVQVRQKLYTGAIGRWKKYSDRLDGLKTALGDLAKVM